MELSAKTVYGAVLKITQRSAHAQNHVSVQRCRKSFTTVVLGDNDFPLTGSNFGNLTAFRAIFRHIFTVHAQKRLFVNFRLKFWYHHSIPWPIRSRSWYDHPLPSYSVIAADTLRDLVTLTFDLLTLVSGHTWQVTWSTPPPSLKILWLSVLELWVLTSPIGYCYGLYACVTQKTGSV